MLWNSQHCRDAYPPFSMGVREMSWVHRNMLRLTAPAPSPHLGILLRWCYCDPTSHFWGASSRQENGVRQAQRWRRISCCIRYSPTHMLSSLLLYQSQNPSIQFNKDVQDKLMNRSPSTRTESFYKTIFKNNFYATNELPVFLHFFDTSTHFQPYSSSLSSATSPTPPTRFALEI